MIEGGFRMDPVNPIQAEETPMDDEDLDEENPAIGAMK